MTRQKVRIDQLVVPAGTPDGHVPTVTAGEMVYAAPTGGTGTARGELLTVDGTTPPENVTTEAEDDWLYEG